MTWLIVATPRERWILAQLLLSADIKVRTDAEMRGLHRLRRALGLLAPTRAAMDNPNPGLVEPPAGKDRRTRNRFELQPEHAESLQHALDQVTKNAAHAFEIAELTEQVLDRQQSAADAATAPPVDPQAEAVLWEIPPPPYLQNEATFVAFFKTVITQAKDFADAKRLFVAGLKTPEEREADAKVSAGLRSV